MNFQGNFLVLFIASAVLCSDLVHGVHVNYRGHANLCHLFQGSWVYDASYPIYDTSRCPFIGIGFDCLKNGRPDLDYLKYRWKPTGCDIPRFNGLDLFEKYRGKKIMFVGDSLSYNMWESFTCMLHSAIPNSNYTTSNVGLLSTVSFPEYGISIMMLKNGFLVDLVYEKIGKILKLDSISFGNKWKEADVLIFNSYHWWTHSGHLQSWDYFQVGSKIVKEMDHMEAYQIGLSTWAKWIDSNIDFSKTKVFFQGVSAVHQNSKEWKSPKSKDCSGETKPIEGATYPGPVHPGEEIVKSVINSMAKPAYLLDITLLTQLRIDGHPSIYLPGTGKAKRVVDCSHWCLAGVPDAWNQLLYAALVQK